jgi:hypothetical protein
MFQYAHIILSLLLFLKNRIIEILGDCRSREVNTENGGESFHRREGGQPGA